MEGKFKLLAVVLVALAVLLGFMRFFAVERQNRQLAGNLQQVQQRVSELESENMNISQMLAKEQQQRKDLEEKNAQIKATLRAGVRRIVSQRSSLVQLQEQAQQLEAEIASMRSENAALYQQQEDIKKQLAQVTKQYESYKRSIVSFAAIKYTFQDLRKQAYKALSTLEKRPSSADEAKGGNGGFLVKNGRPTVSLQKVKIEVNPAPLE